jgi:hypothetical protein
VALYRFLFAPVLLVVAALLGVGGRPRTPAAQVRALREVQPVRATQAPAVRPAPPTPPGRAATTRPGQ